MTIKKKTDRKGNRLTCNQIRCLIGCAFLAAALILQITSRHVSGFGEWYAVTIYPVLVRTIGGLSGLFPCSVVEYGLYLLVFGLFLYGITHIRRPKEFGSMIVFILSLLAFSYTVNCGINYHRYPFSRYLDLEIRESSVEELEALCLFLAEQVAEASEEVKAEANTGQSTEADFGASAAAVRTFPAQAKADMEKLGERYPQLSGFYPKPKPVAISEILSYQSLSGVYSPFTIEANYNADMTAYNIPHTACHELSHLKGFMREDEANFIGYLACVGSDCAYSRYSGYLAGFIYANNALFRQNPRRASQIHAGLPETVLQDLQENNEFWQQYEGRISETATQINDTYLKANRQSEGVKSYGRMVDLLLAYYHSSIGKTEDRK